MKRFCLALNVAICALTMGVASAQPAWPSKAVKMVISTGPGPGTDTFGRLLAERLSRSLGQPFVVENIAGAGGIVAAQSVARAAPDGYTVLFTGGGTLVTNVFAFKSLPYDPVRDLIPVSMVTESGGFVVSATPGIGVTNLAELITLAKSQPGKLSYAVDTSNIYAVILGKWLNKMAGIDMAEIPYKSTPQALQDTVSGRTQIIISAAAPVESFARAGKLRRLGISSQSRNPSIPDLPAMAETLPGFRIDGGGFAVCAPAHTPAEVVRLFNVAIAGVLKDADFSGKMLALGQVTASGASAENAALYLKGERDRWEKIFRELAIEPQ